MTLLISYLLSPISYLLSPTPTKQPATYAVRDSQQSNRSLCLAAWGHDSGPEGRRSIARGAAPGRAVIIHPTDRNISEPHRGDIGPSDNRPDVQRYRSPPLPSFTIRLPPRWGWREEQLIETEIVLTRGCAPG